MTTMTIDAPEDERAFDRSLTQRLEALDRANVVRTRRARLKRDLKAGRVTIYALLSDPPEYLETAKVIDLLLATPKYGRVKANKVLTQCRISPSKTVGGITQRQRSELVKLLRRGPGVEVTGRPPHITRATATVAVRDQLVAVHGMQQIAAISLLRRLHIPPTKTRGELTPRERMHLDRAIDDIVRERRQRAACIR